MRCCCSILQPSWAQVPYAHLMTTSLLPSSRARPITTPTIPQFSLSHALLLSCRRNAALCNSIIDARVPAPKNQHQKNPNVGSLPQAALFKCCRCYCARSCTRPGNQAFSSSTRCQSCELVLRYKPVVRITPETAIDSPQFTTVAPNAGNSGRKEKSIPTMHSY